MHPIRGRVGLVAASFVALTACTTAQECDGRVETLNTLSVAVQEPAGISATRAPTSYVRQDPAP
jgi:hypothetical protein